MAGQHFSLETGQDTLLAVVLGATLATLGGFLAGQFERHIHQRERERNAALLFGEILSSLKFLIYLADASRSRGDPYGVITQRMIRAAQRETEAYDRNRESLYDLRRANDRARIHSILVRMTLAVDGVLSAYDAINSVDPALRAGEAAEADGDHSARLKILMDDRVFAFNYAVALAEEIPDLLKSLNGVANYSFETHEKLMRRTMGID